MRYEGKITNCDRNYIEILDKIEETSYINDKGVRYQD
jgi:hypothetical protein